MDNLEISSYHLYSKGMGTYASLFGDQGVKVVWRATLRDLFIRWYLRINFISTKSTVQQVFCFP